MLNTIFRSKHELKCVSSDTMLPELMQEFKNGWHIGYSEMDNTVTYTILAGSQIYKQLFLDMNSGICYVQVGNKKSLMDNFPHYPRNLQENKDVHETLKKLKEADICIGLGSEENTAQASSATCEYILRSATALHGTVRCQNRKKLMRNEAKKNIMQKG